MFTSNIDVGNPLSDHGMNARGLKSWLPVLPDGQRSRLRDVSNLRGHGALSGSYSWVGGYVSGRWGALKGGMATVTAFDLSAFSISCWVYDSDASNDHNAYQQSDFSSATSFRFVCDMVSSGFSYFQLYTSVTSYQVADTLFRAPNVGRQYYTATWDGSNIRLYRNGVKKNTTATSGTMTFGSGYSCRLNGGNASVETDGYRVENWCRSDGEAYWLYLQAINGYPELLRRYSRRAQAFGSGTGGGTVTENPSPIVATGSVVTPSTALNAAQSAQSATGSVVTPGSTLQQSGTPVAATGSVVNPTTTLDSAQAAVSSTGSVVTPGSSLQTAGTPVVATGSVVDPAGALSQAPSAIASTGSIVTPATSLSIAQAAVSATGSVVNPGTTLTDNVGASRQLIVTATVAHLPVPTLNWGATPIVVTGSVVTPTAGNFFTESPSPVVATGSVASLTTALSWAASAISATFTVVTPTTTGSALPDEGAGWIVAGAVYCPGLIEGRAYSPGVQAGVIHSPGSEQGRAQGRPR